MADMGLKAKIKRVKYRSYKGEIGRVAPNVIARDFKTTGINQKWATDITEYKINDEKGYLSPILDMNNGEIVAYARSRHPDLNLVMKMVDEAIIRKNPPKGLILHSDQGWHYWNTIDDFEAALDEYIKYYNNDRIKLRLDGKSPAQYRALQISNY